MKKIIHTMAVLIFLVSLPLVGQTVQVDDEAPPFSGMTIQDREFSLHDAVNDSIVVLYFMGYS